MNSFPPVIDTVLFDLDGTLVDSFEAFYQISKYGCEAIGLSVPERTTLFPVMNEGASFFDLCFPADLPGRQSQIDAFLHESRQVRFDYLLRYVRLMPDTADLVKRLYESKYKLAIITSSRREALETLSRSGLTEYFDVMITREDVGRLKPHPEGIESALRHLQSDPAKTLMVGDTPMDILAGKAAGTQTAGVLSSTANENLLKNADSDALFASLSDLGVWLQLDASRSSVSSVLLQGSYCGGLGKASDFLSLDWVFQRMKSIAGFNPYPGTFNLDLYPSSIRRLERFREAHDRAGHVFSSEPGFCDAILYPCRLQTPRAAADAFVIFPKVPGYPAHKLEVVAPIRLVERLRIGDAPDVQIEIYI